MTEVKGLEASPINTRQSLNYPGKSARQLQAGVDMKSRIFLAICTLAMAFYVGLVKPEVFLAIKAPVSAEWQLAADQYVSRKMDMTVVYPRTQVSIDGGAKSGNTWARHLWAYPNIQYKIPIVIQGGAYPFKCELVSGPAGMTMGEIYGSTASPTPDYCQIVWTAPASGTFSVSVKVYDQDYQRGGNPSVAVTLDWDIQVNASPFRFVSQGATGGDGLSPSTPWGSIDDWYGSGVTDQSAWNAGARIVYYLDTGGVINGYQTSGNPANNNLSIDSGSALKPIIHLGYPGHSPVIDLWNGSIGAKWFITGMDDLYFAHMEIRDVDPQNADAHQFWIVGSRDFHTFYDLKMHDAVSAGTSGKDNPHQIYYSSSLVTPNLYTAISRVDFDNTVIGPIKYYTNKYSTIEHTTLSNFASHGDTGGIGLQLKGNHQYVSIRDNVWIDNNDGNGFAFFEWGLRGTQGQYNSHVEFSYNRFQQIVKANCELNRGESTVLIGRISSYSSTSDAWSYRNTHMGRVQNQGEAAYGCPGPIVWEDDIIMSDNPPACPHIVLSGACNVEQTDGTIQHPWTDADRPTDANGFLQNATTQWRDLYLGKKGAEIVAP